MAATPIFSASGEVSNNSGTGMGQPISLAANDFTGAGANNVLVFTAGSGGSFLQRLRFKAVGTNALTVARIFINNGLTNATATNNTFWGEIALPATTASVTSATGPEIDYFFNIALNPGFRIYVGLGQGVASGWNVVPVAGKY